ncbi:hypothetical protein PsorP6_004037 [Peronosclerospora sorghi]|uniref:Uncharacterized protein n=1 Tax=Peronosclerospora sorghi TaxID=230839 RepID=A0ACC0VKJ6_9STRA|nr:hypothetical protein PsorP6_004037 [Peronosclerospora sorghi]
MNRTTKSGRRVKRNADEDLAGPNQKRINEADQSCNEDSSIAATSCTPTNINDEKGSRAWAESIVTKVLGGMTLDTFHLKYFERKPLHVRKEEKGSLFDNSLFSRKKMLKIMEKEPHSLSFGKDLTVCRFLNSKRENFDGDDSHGHATSRQVASLLDRGYSCQFYQPQRYVDGLYEINAAFEEVFGGLAGASAYLTPANSQALAPHHDDVEVFILQTQGRKKWKLYRPLVALAGEPSLDLAADQIGEPWMELTMEEGDLLYFPRGVIHEACTDEDQFSTHVTISVYQHNTWANFLEVAMPRIIRQAFDSDIEYRKGLPLRYLSFMGTQYPPDSAKAKEFLVTCKNLVGQLAAYVEERILQEAADEAALDVLANRLPPPGVKTDDESGPNPFDENVTIRYKNRSHIRLSMGEDENKEAFVAIYFSQQNCRRHHMGLCTCNGEDDDDDNNGGDGDDDANDANDDAENGSADGDEQEDGNNDSDNELDGPDAVFSPQPKSIVFPGALAPALMKLYASSASNTNGARFDELVETSNETAVRGMLLRLWSEGLLSINTQS